MWKRRISTVILIFIFFLLQTTLFQTLELANVSPNLLLILTVSIGYMRGRTEGLVVGFVCGIMLDLYGSVVGPCAFILMAIGFAVGYCQKYYFADEFIIPTILITVSGFMYGIYYYFVEFLLRGRLHFGFYFLHVILPEVIYTVVLSLILYRFIRSLEKWLTPKNRREA